MTTDEDFAQARSRSPGHCANTLTRPGTLIVHDGREGEFQAIRFKDLRVARQAARFTDRGPFRSFAVPGHFTTVSQWLEERTR